MLPNYESFLDATPEKGVIIVEYYWQPPATILAKGDQTGVRTSMVFFKRILASDKCWCGSKRQFARCHRRSDDWSYVTLDPDRQAYSPVILFDRVYRRPQYAKVRARLDGCSDLLPIAKAREHIVWGWSASPPIVNEIGTLLSGTVELSDRELHIETNSEKRLDDLSARIRNLLGGMIDEGETRRTEPQQAFPVRPMKRRK